MHMANDILLEYIYVGRGGSFVRRVVGSNPALTAT